jgi:hypothetical protein
MKKPSGLEEKPDGNFSHKGNIIFSALSRPSLTANNKNITAVFFK